MIRKLELSGDLKTLIEILERDKNINCELATKMIFYKWRIITDSHFAFSGHNYMESIKHDFLKYASRFENCALFQFYIGIPIWLEPWTFLSDQEYARNMDYYDKLGMMMIKKAKTLSPNIKLYQYYDTEKKDEKKQLLEELLRTEKLPLMGGEIHAYFMRVLKSMK